MRQYRIPVFIPHEGCPNDCVFCNQKKITGVTTTMTPEQAKLDITEQLRYLPQEKCQIEIAFFGGSFTGIPLEKQEEFYRVADEFRPRIDGIRLSTRPDYINDEVLYLAKQWGVSTIELGAQSASDEVLNKNRRGHTFAQTVAAVKQIRGAGIGVGLQMMTGMYGSSPEKDRTTAQELAKLQPDCVRIYPVLVLKDTALAHLHREGLYQPQTMEEAIETAKEVLKVFRKKQIPVIRLGLHAGEELREEGVVLAGPFHPAFGELVESRIYRDSMVAKLEEYSQMPKVFEFSAEQDQISKVVGHGRCNAVYLKEKYGVTLKVKVCS